MRVHICSNAMILVNMSVTPTNHPTVSAICAAPLESELIFQTRGTLLTGKEILGEKEVFHDHLDGSVWITEKIFPVTYSTTVYGRLPTITTPQGKCNFLYLSDGSDTVETSSYRVDFIRKGNVFAKCGYDKSSRSSDWWVWILDFDPVKLRCKSRDGHGSTYEEAYKEALSKSVWDRALTMRYDGLVMPRPSELTIQAAKRDLSLMSVADYPAPPPASQEVYSRLCVEAVKNINYVDINSLAFINDFRKIKELLPPISDLKNIKNPKTWANLYLWGRYGLRLTALDSRELVKSVCDLWTQSSEVNPKGWSRCRARSVDEGIWKGRRFKRTVAYKARLRDIRWGPMDIIRNSMEWDLWPTLSNMYDMIPFSFVLDWFINVGDQLESIDTLIQYQYYDCLSTTVSEKTEYRVYLPSHPSYSVWGDVRRVSYCRYVRSHLDPPPFGLEFSLPNSHQLIDAAALIVSNHKAR